MLIGNPHLLFLSFQETVFAFLFLLSLFSQILLSLFEDSVDSFFEFVSDSSSDVPLESSFESFDLDF